MRPVLLGRPKGDETMPIIVGGNIIEGSEPPEFSAAGVPADGTDEIQTITIGGTPETASTFRLAYEGFTTAPIVWHATTGTLIAHVDAALEALPNIGTAGVTTADVNLSSGVGTFTVTFNGDNGKKNVALMVGSAFLQSTGVASTGTVSVATTTPGVDATSRGTATGSEYTNATTGVRYVNTGTPQAPTWTTVSDTLGTSLLGSVTPGTVSANKALVVDGSKMLNEFNVTGAVTVDGLVADTHSIATPTSAIRLLKSELTVTGAVSGMGTNSAAGVRGLLTLAAAANATSGFYYGTQGKLVADSATIAVGAGHVAGVYAQLSAASGTVTSGHVAAVIADVQTPPSTGALLVDCIYAEQVTGTAINSILKAVAFATYAFDLSSYGNTAFAPAAGTGAGSAGAATGVASRVLKVMIDGAAAFIPLFTANT
jgi:hypothetical protein